MAINMANGIGSSNEADLMTSGLTNMIIINMIVNMIFNCLSQFVVYPLGFLLFKNFYLVRKEDVKSK
jgi:hypothetical protein